MKRTHHLVMFTVLLGIGMVVVVHRSISTGAGGADQTDRGSAPRSPSGTAVEDPAELADMRRELVQLKRQVWAQEQRLAAGSPASGDAQAPATPGKSRSDSEARAEQERKHQDYLAGVEDSFRKEPTDPRWSSIASSAVQTALESSSDLRPLARGVECRSHTCRVEIANTRSGGLAKSLPLFVQRVGQELPSVVADHVGGPDGIATIVLYMSRQDEPRPLVP